MAENSKIEWTDHTFNPWIGCTKVSPGCANCYADAQDKFRKWTPEGWGKGKPRKRTSATNWKLPLKWNDEAGEKAHLANLECPGLSTDGKAHWSHRPRVFCASLADWLDDEVPIEWLSDLLALIHATPNLDWLLLTKRPENFSRRVGAVADQFQSSCEMAVWWAKRGVYPENVWIGTTVEDQTRADERIPELLKIPARVRFLSCEPLLGEVEVSWFLPHTREVRKGVAEIRDSTLRTTTTLLLDADDARPMIHWVIVGGESGSKARPMHPDWARSLRDQCQAAGVPFLFKQWGEWLPAQEHYTGPEWRFQDGRLEDSHWFPDFNESPKGWEVDHATATIWKRLGKAAAGRQLDGREWNEFPTLNHQPSTINPQQRQCPTPQP